MSYQVLLYYLYTDIEQPEVLVESQRALCQGLNLTGRILIAREGINGTVEGAVEETEQYMREVTKDPRFSAMQFKKSPGSGTAFPKLSVRARQEIVSAHLGEKDVNPAECTGTRLSPTQLYELIHSDQEFYVVDMRNDYEQAVGRFTDSILPPIHHFRQLPEVARHLEHLKEKAVVTVCTGGVRCEKASGYLLTQGFREVYQLDGGIASYMEQYPGEDFEGALYVFDGRITTAPPVSSRRVIIGKCEHCAAPCERYVNCADLSCHRHFICCQQCDQGETSTYCKPGPSV